MAVGALLVAGTGLFFAYEAGLLARLAALPRALETLLDSRTESRPQTNSPQSRGPAQATPLERLQELIVAGRGADLPAALAAVSGEELDRPLRGMTALMRAASVGDPDVVGLLLERGADPNGRGHFQRTALQYAVEKNRIEAATLLLDAGADIDGVDNTRLSPLVMAADRNYTKLALLLIERGANVNLQHVKGWTALMDAAKSGNVKLVRALLAAGARSGARHSNGWTALDFARNGGHQQVVELLRQAGEALPGVRTGEGTPPATAKKAKRE